MALVIQRVHSLLRRGVPLFASMLILIGVAVAVPALVRLLLLLAVVVGEGGRGGGLFALFYNEWGSYGLFQRGPGRALQVAAVMVLTGVMLLRAKK